MSNDGAVQRLGMQCHGCLKPSMVVYFTPSGTFCEDCYEPEELEPREHVIVVGDSAKEPEEEDS